MIIKQFDLLLKENTSFEYGRSNRKKFRDAEFVYNFCNSEGLSLGMRGEEHVYVFALNCKCELIGMMQTGMGGIASAPIDVRNILTFGLQSGASGLIICHNHPSGDLTISPEDRDSTQRLQSACTLIGLKLLDHLIISRYGFTSFKQENLL